MGCIRCIWLGIGFGIWAEIPLFWAVATVRDLIEGDVGWFGVRFLHGRSHGRIRGGLGVTFLNGYYY